MMKRSDFYGWVGADLGEVAAGISARLGLELHTRWSDHRGGYYWSTVLGAHPSIYVMRNAEDEEGQLHEEDHPEMTVLLDSADLTDEQCALLEEMGGRLLHRAVF